MNHRIKENKSYSHPFVQKFVSLFLFLFIFHVTQVESVFCFSLFPISYFKSWNTVSSGLVLKKPTQLLTLHAFYTVLLKANKPTQILCCIVNSLSNRHKTDSSCVKYLPALVSFVDNVFFISKGWYNFPLSAHCCSN